MKRATIKNRLLESRENREGFIRAKLNHLIPSQIKALRLRHIWTQSRLAEESDMKQARVSAMEKPGEVNFSLETLIRLAAAYGVALQVRFVPFSKLSKWEDEYSQDSFDVTRIEKDLDFTDPSLPRTTKTVMSILFTQPLSVRKSITPPTVALEVTPSVKVLEQEKCA
jgi:transcriptional regulator with XRE-family HTH domain